MRALDSMSMVPVLRCGEGMGTSGATDAISRTAAAPAVAHDMSTPTLPAVSPGATASETLLLIVRLGVQRFALPAAPIARILPMAAPMPLVAPAPGVVGGLVIAGALLPIVDPRPALGIPPGVPGVAQHLLLLDAVPPFLLWIDRAEAIERARVQIDDTTGQSALARLGDTYLPVLDLRTFAPAAGAGWDRAGW